MKRIAMFVFFVSVVCCVNAQTDARIVQGRIFLDRNENGLLDRGEKGLSGIPVSNGDTIIFTAKDGRFSLAVLPNTSLFPILPATLESTGSVIGNSNFVYFTDEDLMSTDIVFGVRKIRRVSRFKVGAIGDVQVSNQQEFAYANASLMSELAERSDIDFNIFLGDLVNDNVRDFPQIKTTLERMSAKSWLVAGNHDRDAVEENQQNSFNRVFGAADYAFNYGDVHFIVLNNIYPKGKRGYEGRFTERQLRFLKNDLSLVPPEKLVVVAQHIPMAGVKNKHEFLTLLGKHHKVLILSGHTHRVSRQYLIPGVMEIGVGASCGNFWTGERNWQGTPSALMQCGSPRNYFVLRFSKNDYQFQFKGVGLDPTIQMSVWINQQDSVDQHVPVLRDLDERIVMANVFAGSNETMVKMQVDNGDWVVMQKADVVDPYVARIVYQNKLGIYPSDYSRRAALRSSNSQHIWQAKLPESISAGIHLVKIEATEANGFCVSNRKIFFVR